MEDKELTEPKHLFITRCFVCFELNQRDNMFLTLKNAYPVKSHGYLVTPTTVKEVITNNYLCKAHYIKFSMEDKI